MRRRGEDGMTGARKERRLAFMPVALALALSPTLHSTQRYDTAQIYESKILVLNLAALFLFLNYNCKRTPVTLAIPLLWCDNQYHSLSITSTSLTKFMICQPPSFRFTFATAALVDCAYTPVCWVGDYSIDADSACQCTQHMPDLIGF